jgi:tetratricopeptide (TPR) repeat protein
LTCGPGPERSTPPDASPKAEADTKDAQAFYARGHHLQARGEHNEAIKAYSEAIQLDPMFVDAYNNRGLAWHDKGEDEKAIPDFSEAIRINPKYAAAYYNRGLAWLDLGDPEKALADLNEAIRLRPRDAKSYCHRGNAWWDLGEYQKARVDYDEVTRLDPKDAWGYNRQAWLRATCPDEKCRDGQKAVALAARACELSGKEPAHLDTLAAAHAEAGDYADAIRREQDALSLVPTDSPYRTEMMERLRLYQSGKPYRDVPSARQP